MSARVFSRVTALLLASTCATISAPSFAQPYAGQDALRNELAEARAQIAEQQRRIESQEQRLRALEARLTVSSITGVVPPSAAVTPPAPAVSVAQGSGSTVAGDPASIQVGRIEQVGTAPADLDRPPELAVLGQQGSVVTRRGQLTGEMQLEYARADRNRAIFRGIEVVESVLVGVFDINESRQDVLTAAGSLRYGLTSNLEIGARVPYVYRNDRSVLAPVAGSTPNDPAATRDNSANGNGIGDIELSARYQLASASGGWPFLIANIQAVLPTGTDPFDVRRDANGLPLEASTGAGFWGISPSITAILPSDPAVLFGTIGYTFNLGHSVDTRIPPVIIDYVDPGDAISASAGIGISLNQRASLNLGYAHTWAFGTRTRTRAINPGPNDPGPVTSRSRDLQIGRLLFGVTYRVTDRASVNWSVEAGITGDATDMRTVIRIPLILLAGS